MTLDLRDALIERLKPLLIPYNLTDGEIGEVADATLSVMSNWTANEPDDSKAINA